jgi:uncharacterized membrane protein (DUF373 family)
MTPQEPAPHPNDRAHGRDIGRFVEPLLAHADRLIYAVVALFLVIGAVLILGYSVVAFVDNAAEDFILAVIALINDVLLVLILLELLGTVRDYLATGRTSLRTFLYVGIISAIRRVLAIGAETTVGEGVDATRFRNLMIDLGVNAFVVLALAAALFLFSRQGRWGRDVE